MISFRIATIFPVIMGICLIYFLIYYIRIIRPKAGTTEWVGRRTTSPQLALFPEPFRMEKQDVLPVVLISLFFSVLAVYNIESAVAAPYFAMFYFAMPPIPLGEVLWLSAARINEIAFLDGRYLGALAGILMLVVMYIFIKNMFGRTSVAICGTLIFGFDFMRFVESRIGVIIPFGVLFTLMAFYFTYRFVTRPFRDSVLPLALSGIFFGLSVAVTWTAIFAGIGIFAILIYSLFMLKRHYKINELPGYGKRLAKTVLFSLLFFIVVPLIIYIFSHISQGQARGMTIAGGMLWDPEFYRLTFNRAREAIYWLTYHRWVSPYPSMWWRWIINTNPILYSYVETDGIVSAVASFGNPLVWWGGFLAIIVMAARVFMHRDNKALFILLGYLSVVVPWVFFTRGVHTLHYFPATLFLCLGLAHMFDVMHERSPVRRKRAKWIFTFGAAAVFVMFYPVISGFSMPEWYYGIVLRWLPTWPF